MPFRNHMRQVTAINPSAALSRHSSVQPIAPARSRIRTLAKMIAAWAMLVKTKARTTAKYRGRRAFEFGFGSGIDRTWLLCGGKWEPRLSCYDGGGSPMIPKYEKGVFGKFDEAVNDAEQNDRDPTILFIATDGKRLFKAFNAPDSSVDDPTMPTFSKGFDDDTFIGVWSHSYLRDAVERIEAMQDGDGGWGEEMERMVAQMADYADSYSPPESGNC